MISYIMLCVAKLIGWIVLTGVMVTVSVETIIIIRYLLAKGRCRK